LNNLGRCSKKSSDSKFHEDPPSMSQALPWERTDRKADMTKLTVAFPNSAKTAYKLFKSVRNVHTVHSPSPVLWSSTFLSVQSHFSVHRILFSCYTFARRSLLKSVYEIIFNPYGENKFPLSEKPLKLFLRFAHCAYLLTYLLIYLTYFLTYSMLVTVPLVLIIGYL
jgi:hypothetical protein